jgi:C1A family cysteine protease
MVTPQSSDQLKAALVNSPVAVSVQADEDVFQFYSSGVVRKGCSASLNHAVLAVGYQKLGLFEAFIVKNSWGTSWGSDGYIYLATDQTQNAGKGVCGILVRPVIVTA